MRKLLASLVLALSITSAFGITQYHTGDVSIGTKALDAASILQINSTTKGILPPRMTLAERDAIATPPTGLIVFNTTAGTLDIYVGGVWVPNVGGSVGAWLTAIDYKIGNVVHESNQIYLALTNHTSGTFATDLAANDWIELSSMDFTKPVNGVNAIANGGTNSAAALSNSFVMESVGGAIVESTTTSTELTYLDATSSIQTQLDAKIDDYTSTTDNALIRSSGTSGVLIQDSGVILSDVDALTGITSLSVDNITIDGNIISSTDVNGSINLTPNGTGVVHVTGPTASRPMKLSASNDITSGLIDLADTTTEVTGTLATGNGGTGVTTATNGQLLIGNGTGFTAASLTGTADQVIVTDGAGSITLSTPQSINTTSSPTFADITISNADSNGILFRNATGAIDTDSTFLFRKSDGFMAIGGGFSGSMLTVTGTSNFTDSMIAANATFTSIGATSTTSASQPFPPMTETQRNAVALTPPSGSGVYNTTTQKINTYNATTAAWEEVGGGGGGALTNLIIDPSFETDVSEGTCTGCTASQETTIVMLADKNAGALKMAFSAGSGDYTDTTTTSAEFTNVPTETSAWIKTSAADCHLVEMVDGAESQTVAISTDDTWKKYVISGTSGTTSYGYRVECNTSITDNVYVDEVYSGPIVEPLINIAQAQFYGSVKWSGVASCEWNRSNAAFGDFPLDAQCDDAVRVIKGEYNSTSGAIGNVDGESPKIKFSTMKAGTYRIEAKGNFSKTNTDGVCKFRFSDGTNSTVANEVYVQGTIQTRVPIILGEFHYDLPKTSETTISLQAMYESASPTCTIQVWDASDELEISVYYYPSPQKIFASKCDGLECENTFTAKIGSTGTIASENVSGWIASATNPTTGNYTLTFLSGLFGSQAPHCVVTGMSGDRDCYGHGNPSTTTFPIRCNNESGAQIASDFHLTCTKNGSDYNQFDQRFVPVTDRQSEGYYAYKQANFMDSAVAYEYNWDHTKLIGKGSTPVIGSSNLITIDETTAASQTRIVAKENILLTLNFISNQNNTGSATSLIFDSDDNTIASELSSTAGYAQTLSISIVLAKDDYIYMGCTAGGCTDATGGMNLTAQPQNLKAFIGNLTPTEFVQTPSAVKPVIYSAEISAAGIVSVEIGNFLTSCTNASPMVCTLETGAFVGAFNCVPSGFDSSNQSCNSQTYVDGTSFNIKCNNDAATDTTTTIKKKVICHGVQ